MVFRPVVLVLAIASWKNGNAKYDYQTNKTNTGAATVPWKLKPSEYRCRKTFKTKYKTKKTKWKAIPAIDMEIKNSYLQRKYVSELESFLWYHTLRCAQNTALHLIRVWIGEFPLISLCDVPKIRLYTCVITSTLFHTWNKKLHQLCDFLTCFTSNILILLQIMNTTPTRQWSNS